MTTILLVEEDQDQRHKWSRWLVEKGYRVDECSDALEAARVVRQKRPGLVICSARLQDAEQAVPLHEIKATDGTIPVVLYIEGSLSENDIRYGLADACVLQSACSKPLLQAVAELL